MLKTKSCLTALTIILFKKIIIVSQKSKMKQLIEYILIFIIYDFNFVKSSDTLSKIHDELKEISQQE